MFSQTDVNFDKLKDYLPSMNNYVYIHINCHRVLYRYNEQFLEDFIFLTQFIIGWKRIPLYKHNNKHKTDIIYDRLESFRMK